MVRMIFVTESNRLRVIEINIHSLHSTSSVDALIFAGARPGSTKLSHRQAVVAETASSASGESGD